MGPKFGKLMKSIAIAVEELSLEEILKFESERKYSLKINDTVAVIELSDVEILTEDAPGMLTMTNGNLTVGLDIEITEELRFEGIARELVNRIQNIRKSSGLEITDKIKITLSKNPQTDSAVINNKDYICNQVLGTSLELKDFIENGTEIEFENFKLHVSIVKE